MKKSYLYIIIGIAVLGTAGYLFIWGGNGNDLKYRTEKVTRGEVSMQVRATGTINPIKTVRVGSQVSGIVSKLYVDFNSQVTKGQIVAQIDSTFLMASVKEAQANLERNQAQVSEATRTYNRTQELFKKELVSQADLDAAQATYESAVAQLKQTRAALDRTIVNLRYATIRAPIDGVVISRDVDVGQTVAASLQAPQLLSIANDLKQMQVEASVDEADIGQIREGQSVTFTVDSYPDEQFRGTVSQVRLAPVTVQNVVTYTVVIDVPNPELKLRPGMTATVSILIDRRDNVLRIPTMAIRFQPPPEVLAKFQPAGAEQASGQAVQRTEGQQRDTSGRGQGRAGGEGRRQWRGQRQGGGGGDSNRGMGERRPMRIGMSRIWILENGRTLKPIMVRTGLNDNRYLEVLEDGLKEGDEVIIGVTGAESASNMQGQSNPFQQRMPGGGGGRGR
jgi:HlyD family secretion protein